MSAERVITNRAPSAARRMIERMKKTIAAVIVAAAAGAALAGPAQAAEPSAAPAVSAVPGRYCAAAYKGKVVKTARYGRVKCKPDGSRFRWKKV